MTEMSAALPYLIGFFMAATLIVLFIGVVSFATNSKVDAKHSNMLMRARVALQAVAVALFALLVYLSS